MIFFGNSSVDCLLHNKVFLGLCYYICTYDYICRSCSPMVSQAMKFLVHSFCAGVNPRGGLDLCKYWNSSVGNVYAWSTQQPRFCHFMAKSLWFPQVCNNTTLSWLLNMEHWTNFLNGLVVSSDSLERPILPQTFVKQDSMTRCLILFVWMKTPKFQD